MSSLGSMALGELGLGDQLGQQVAAESDDERRKRMLALQQQQKLGPAGSLAVTWPLAGTGRGVGGY